MELKKLEVIQRFNLSLDRDEMKFIKRCLEHCKISDFEPRTKVEIDMEKEITEGMNKLDNLISTMKHILENGR